MSKINENLSEIFDVPLKVADKPPLPVAVKTPEPISNLEKDLDDDYVDARDTMKELVTKGNQAIDHLLAIASDTEHPRAFEVVATLIKNTAEANEKLLNIQRQMREMKGMNKKESGKVNVDKAIFVGSTSELSKLINNRNADNE